MKARRVYGWLLLVWPASFRRSYGAAAARDFQALYDDARALGVGAVAGLWLRTVWTVVGGGVAERWNVLRGTQATVANSAVPGRPGREREDGWSTGSRRHAGGRGSGLAVFRDAGQSLRGLRQRPAFVVAILVLVGLGVGATTTIFSVVDAVVLRPLPYPHAERLVMLLKGRSGLSIPDFQDVRDRVRGFEAVGAAWTVSADLTGTGEPARLSDALVTAEFFEIVGAHAWRGRLFNADEYAPGAAPVVVLSASLWLSRWGGDASIIGGTVLLHGQPTTVVGVLDPGFVPPEALGLEDTHVYQPLDLAREQWQTRTMFILAPIARVRPDVPLRAAEAQLAELAERLADEHPDAWRTRTGEHWSFTMLELQQATVGGVRNTLWMFLGAVSLMLLIACANVANLHLARAMDRTHEMAVRTALGASRTRIVMQLLIESVGLALLGGAVGVALAQAGVSVFSAMQPAGIPRLVELSVDGRVLIFGLAISAATGILFGLAPAFASARTRAAGVLRESSPATTSGHARTRLRNALVIFQLALATLLLSGAGVLMHSFVRLNNVATGFEPRALLTLQLDTDARVLPSGREQFVDRLLGRIDGLPGVHATGASWRLPFDRGRCCWSTRMHDPTTPGDTVQPYIHPVTPGYFRSLGVTVMEGRDFAPTDRGSVVIPDAGGTAMPGQVPVVLNRTMADRLFPGRSAVGRSIAMFRMDPVELRVIGVIDGLRHWSMDREPGPDIYVPFATVAQWHLGLLDVAIRHDGDPGSLARSVQSAVHELDADLPIERVATMESRIAQSVATPRFHAMLLATFAAVAFVLAAAGVYSSMLYVVGLRRRELGIRVALGAARQDVVRLIVGSGARLVVAGTVIGLMGAFALARVLQSLVFEVSVTDPFALTFAAVALAGIGLLACWLPARWAAGSDPVSTLRSG